MERRFGDACVGGKEQPLAKGRGRGVTVLPLQNYVSMMGRWEAMVAVPAEQAAQDER
jgi:hypothetical protein